MPVQVAVMSKLHVTVKDSWKLLMGCTVRLTFTVPPGGPHALPAAGGCKLKSTIFRVYACEVATGPLAI